MKRVIYNHDLKPSKNAMRLRYCKAFIFVTDNNDFEFISYTTTIMRGRLSEDRRRVLYVEFFPYRSRTTWGHVRKFCYLFSNGKTIYNTYRKAAAGSLSVGRFW